MQTHTHYLALALSLADIRRGFCAPNPAVAAIVVKDQKILATGYHWAHGHPHAEVEALNKLDPAESEGATLYVTLEPCSHWGKTPPCSEQIVARGIKEVFYACPDPNPQVAGKGVAYLRRADIACVEVNFAPIKQFYQSYLHWWQTGRPYVTGKLALSLDGKIAGPQGEPVTITGERLKQYTHEQRKRADAILTTAVTINKDNPQLNARLESEIFPKPIYILDSHLSLSLTASIFATAKKIVLFHQAGVDELRLQQLKNMNVQCIGVKHHANGLSLLEVLEHVGAHGIHDLWVEAGAKCFQAFLTAGLMQRALIYLAPKLLGKNALSAFADQLDILQYAKNIHWQGFGKDVMCEIELLNTLTEKNICLPV